MKKRLMTSKDFLAQKLINLSVSLVDIYHSLAYLSLENHTKNNEERKYSRQEFSFPYDVFYNEIN